MGSELAAIEALPVERICEPLPQTANLGSQGKEFPAVLRVDIAEPLRDNRLCFHFSPRTLGYREKSQEISSGMPAFAVSDVRRNGYGRPSHLASQAIQFVLREVHRDPVDKFDEAHRLLP